MSEPLQLTDVWQRSLDATVQFYSALGQLAVDCVESLLFTASNSIASVRPVEAQPASVPEDGSSRAPTTSTSATMSTMVLEAAAGRKALGVFLVENGFSRAVSASAAASAFVDDDGKEINPTVEFQPTSITLEPGEQMLVKVLASIDKDMPAGIRYRGEIGVPGLMGTRIPVVLGRTAEAKPPGSKKSHIISAAGARNRIPGRNSPPLRKSKKRAAKA